MKVTVHVTYEEFAEAAAAVRDRQIQAFKRKERRSAATYVTALVFMVALFLSMSIIESFDAMPHLRPSWYSTLLIVAPATALFLLASVTTVAQQTASAGKFALRLVLALLPLFGVLVVVTALTLLPLLIPPRAGPSAQTDWYSALAPHAVWMLIMVGWIVMLVRATWRRNQQSWDAQPGISRPRVFDITSAGVTIDEQVSQNRYTWPAFARFMETRNLLLLCPSDITFEIIPKRCFATPADLDAVRALLDQEIRDRTKERAAFPVIPAPPAAPIAPPPLPQSDRPA